MKKTKLFFLLAALAAWCNFVPLYADAIPYLPVKVNLEGTAVDLASFELPSGDFSMDLQCNAGASISICGVYEYTAEGTSLRIARKNETVVVYEGNVYKATLSGTLTPIAGITNATSATLFDGAAYGQQVTLGAEDYWDMTLYVINPEFNNSTMVNKAPFGWAQTTSANTSKISVAAKGDGSVIFADENHWQIYSGGKLTGKAYQIITGLPLGKYKFKAGLYAAITGPVHLYANSGRLEVVNDSSAIYEVEGIVVDGTLEIGMDIATTGGTTLEFDHITLEYHGADMGAVVKSFQELVEAAQVSAAEHMNATAKAKLNAAISAAETILQNPTEEAITQASPTLRLANDTAKLSIAEYVNFKAAIDSSEVHMAIHTALSGYATYSTVFNSTKAAYNAAQIQGDSINSLISALTIAEVACLLTQEAPYDATFVMVNPSFENSDSYKGWVNNGMQTQTNASFELKVGNRYVEKWVADGGMLANASITQTINNLPNGAYELTIVGFCTQGGLGAEGGYLFANKGKTQMGEAGEYTVEAVVMDNTLSFGIKTEDCTGNWIAADNFTLRFIGYNLSVAVATLEEIIYEAKDLSGSGSPMSQSAFEELETAIAAAGNACKTPTEEGIKAASTALATAMDNVETSIQQYTALIVELDRLADLCDNGAELYPDGHEAFVDVYFEVAELYAEGSYDSEGIIAAIKQLKEAEFSCYLSSTPPIDATFILKNPSFEDGNANWTVKSGVLNTSSANCQDGLKAGNTWSATYRDTDFYQEISLPAGQYELTAVMRVGLVTNQYIYAEIGGQKFKSNLVEFAGSWSEAGDLSAWNDMSLTFTLNSSGTIRIGAAGEIEGFSGDGYYQIDDFRLTLVDKVSSTNAIQEDHNSLSVAGSKGGVYVTSPASCTIAIHAIDGVLLNTQEISEGETFITLPQGTYLIGGKTAIVL